MTNKQLDQMWDQRIAAGFQNSYIKGKAVRVRCGGCEALVINGIATHERGCPNARHECRGCNELIPMNQRYCQDCQ